MIFLENIALFYERQLPMSQKAQIISNSVAYLPKPFSFGVWVCTRRLAASLEKSLSTRY